MARTGSNLSDGRTAYEKGCTYPGRWEETVRLAMPIPTTAMARPTASASFMRPDGGVPVGISDGGGSIASFSLKVDHGNTANLPVGGLSLLRWRLFPASPEGAWRRAALLLALFFHRCESAGWRPWRAGQRSRGIKQLLLGNTLYGTMKETGKRGSSLLRHRQEHLLLDHQITLGKWRMREDGQVLLPLRLGRLRLMKAAISSSKTAPRVSPG